MADTLDELEALYRARYATFVRVAHAIVGHEQSARDVVHDGFVLAVRSRGRLRDERAVEPWVWRIVVNEARKRRAREARRERESAEPVGSYGPAELNVDVRALIAALPERQRLERPRHRQTRSNRTSYRSKIRSADTRVRFSTRA